MELTQSCNAIDEDRIVDAVKAMNANTVAFGEPSGIEACSQLANGLFTLFCGPKAIGVQSINIQRLVLIELGLVKVIRENVLVGYSEPAVSRAFMRLRNEGQAYGKCSSARNGMFAPSIDQW